MAAADGATAPGAAALEMLVTPRQSPTTRFFFLNRSAPSVQLKPFLRPGREEEEEKHNWENFISSATTRSECGMKVVFPAP